MALDSGQIGRPARIRAVPVRHPGRWVTAAIVCYLTIFGVYVVSTNPRFEWAAQWHYAFSSSILDGVRSTLIMTFAAMAIGIIGGVILAIMRLSPNPILSRGAWFFIWVFRATPVLVQLLVWSYLGSLFPSLGVGIPFGPSFHRWETNQLISALMAALLGLGLNEAAYMAEIVRAGIVSVDAGQVEASSALGFSRLRTMRMIVLPQAMRVIIPPTGNETISMLKTTSLISVVPYYELLYATRAIYANTYQVIPMLIMASLWYAAMSSVLMVGQFYIERHYSRGFAHAGGNAVRRRWRSR